MLGFLGRALEFQKEKGGYPGRSLSLNITLYIRPIGNSSKEV